MVLSACYLVDGRLVYEPRMVDGHTTARLPKRLVLVLATNVPSERAAPQLLVSKAVPPSSR